MSETRTEFGQRLKDYGKWRDQVNVDRFIVLVYLTAEEKAAASQRMFGIPDVVYVDGADVEAVTLKAGAKEAGIAPPEPEEAVPVVKAKGRKRRAA